MEAGHGSSEALDSLAGFRFGRVLREDALDGTIIVLGTLNEHAAIVSLVKTAFDVSKAADLTSTVARLQTLGHNDVYHWFLGWFASDHAEPHVKINVICPATEVHIRKYSEQTSRIVRETPDVYRTVVQPYIASFPESRTRWVYQILDHITESERIIYEDPDPLTGFLIIPDLKWDQTTISALYVQTIVRDRSIRSLRDLRASHLPLLRKIYADGRRAVAERYGLDEDELRVFVHYQPSYYHLHVHMLHVGLRGYAGSTTGQSHMLADIIDNLELDEQEAASSPYYERRTLTYAIGSQHGLFEGLAAST